MWITTVRSVAEVFVVLGRFLDRLTDWIGVLAWRLHYVTLRPI